MNDDLRYSLDVILDSKTGGLFSSILINLNNNKELRTDILPDHDFFRCENWHLLFITHGKNFWCHKVELREKTKNELWLFSISAYFSPATFKVFEKFLDFIAPHVIASEGSSVGEGFDVTKNLLNYIKYSNKKIVIEPHVNKTKSSTITKIKHANS